MSYLISPFGGSTFGPLSQFPSSERDRVRKRNYGNRKIKKNNLINHTHYSLLQSIKNPLENFRMIWFELFWLCYICRRNLFLESANFMNFFFSRLFLCYSLLFFIAFKKHWKCRFLLHRSLITFSPWLSAVAVAVVAAADADAAAFHRRRFSAIKDKHKIEIEISE